VAEVAKLVREHGNRYVRGWVLTEVLRRELIMPNAMRLQGSHQRLQFETLIRGYARTTPHSRPRPAHAAFTGDDASLREPQLQQS
jgi:hypothetical protein